MQNEPTIEHTDSRSRDRAFLTLAVLALTALFAAVFTLRTGTAAIERGESFAWGAELTRTLLHWCTSLLFVPLLAWTVRRSPLTRRRWVVPALILLAAALAASAARTLLDPVLAMALGADLPAPFRLTRVLAALGGYLAVIGMLHALHFHDELRRRERETLVLSQSLAEARAAASEMRLSVLRAQLQPHFLFNALNAVAALVHHDPLTADRMLTRLSELLRTMLLPPATDEHRLQEELAVLDQYLDVMQLRFGDRLSIRREIAHGVSDAMVPWMVLQPLAENALEHGLWPKGAPGTLLVRAEREGDRLRLTIEDDGVGIDRARTTVVTSSDRARGVGLSNTMHRLATLYGEAATLRTEARVGGGTRTEIHLPLRRAIAAAA